MKASAWLLAIPAVLAAQQQPPRFTSETKMVRLLVNVKDAKGDLVGSLEKSDFAVYDCGVKQEIDSFERETALAAVDFRPRSTSARQP